MKNMDKMEKRYFWKGKRVTEKVYKARINQQKAGSRVRKIYGKKSGQHNLEASNYFPSSHDQYNYGELEGRQIIHKKTLANGLICKNCGAVLSLLDTTGEKQHGLAYVLYIVCRQCKRSNQVFTDKQHNVAGKGQRKHFDCNTKAVIGILNAGAGNTTLNKVLSALNMSSMSWDCFKSHEKEVGHVVDEMVFDTCKRATEEEKQLTIANSEKLTALLPNHLKRDFLFPDVKMEENNKKILSKSTVRVMASFDMGWPTKGSGRSYDSLSGTAGLIGYFSKKILSQVVLNRKCRKCDLGCSKDKHDCRLNFEGSAKAMEPKAAALLVGDNDILSKCNVQLGIFVGDNDSCAINAARNAVNYEIVKFDDLNHTGKGVTSELYKYIKSFKELTATTIQYLGKCFKYSVTQNVGNELKISEAIKNIPQHCFNIHTECGDWCGYKKNPDSYKHKIIGKGFQDPNLLETLTNIFNRLAQKASRFSAGVSSNPNESFNAMVASKSPKSKMYGMSNSYNIRVGLAVNKKNDGEKFITALAKKCQLSPGRKTRRFCRRVDESSKRKYRKSIKPAFKRRRLFLKKRKSELRHKNELSEGTTYQPNVTLLDSTFDDIEMASVDENLPPIVVFFDLETGDLCRDGDILQIAVKYKEYTFSVYIRPSRTISDKASQVHGLTFVNGQLELNGKAVITVALQEAVVSLYRFLLLFNRKCILTAHNCTFDYTRLMRDIEKTFMDIYFKTIVSGFADTLPLIRAATGLNKAGDNKLENLGKRLGIQGFQAHDALGDVSILEKVVSKLGINEDLIIQSSLKWDDIKQKILSSHKCQSLLKSYKELSKCVSVEMRKRMIASDISYKMIIDIYKQEGEDGITRLFGADENGKVRVTKSIRVITKLCDFLRTKYEFVAYV